MFFLHTSVVNVQVLLRTKKHPVSTILDPVGNLKYSLHVLIDVCHTLYLFHCVTECFHLPFYVLHLTLNVVVLLFLDIIVGH